MRTMTKHGRARRVMLAATFLIAAATLHGQWNVGAFEDLMAGTSDPYIMLRASAHQNTLRTPSVVIVEREAGLEVYIVWGGYNMDRDLRNVIARFGESEPDVWTASLSTSREATFITRTEEFIAAMLEHDGENMVVSGRRSTGPTSVGLWDLTGITEVFVETFGPLEGE